MSNGLEFFRDGYPKRTKRQNPKRGKKEKKRQKDKAQVESCLYQNNIFAFLNPFRSDQIYAFDSCYVKMTFLYPLQQLMSSPLSVVELGRSSSVQSQRSRLMDQNKHSDSGIQKCHTFSIKDCSTLVQRGGREALGGA